MPILYPFRDMGPQSGVTIGQRFGQNLIDYSSVGLSRHNGVDFPAPKGTPIIAVADGYIIEQTAKDTGYGLRICLKFSLDGKLYVAVYGHMERLEDPTTFAWNFTNGKTVKKGHVIGYVDSTGFSTGNHLHFGMYEYDAQGNKLNSNNGDGGAMDPMPFFGRYPSPAYTDAELRINNKPMNQTKIVLSKDGKTVYRAVPVATDFENFKKQAGVEGIEVPNPIPPASSL